MEDAIAVVPALIAGFSAGETSPAAARPRAPAGSGRRRPTSSVAFFCAEKLHVVLAEEVWRAQAALHSAGSPGDWEAVWRAAITATFSRIDSEISGKCTYSQGHAAGSRACAGCCREPVAPETVGTTAVVAVIGSQRILVANCGDSRAVLSSGGTAVPLSSDHKPDRNDERERVEAAGGRVIFWNGHRVLGVLAMSRSLGDRYLSPYVIAEPEISCTVRSREDEAVILASDGLWDVISNEAACSVVRKVFSQAPAGAAGSRSSATGISRSSPSPFAAAVAEGTQSSDSSGGSGSAPSAAGAIGRDDSQASMAAALLVKLALAKGSGDNVTVAVIDLRPARP
eukprot:SM000009S23475  [mRNA]  locus=s9:270632:272478:+ [translate_table: standard]